MAKSFWGKIIMIGWPSGPLEYAERFFLGWPLRGQLSLLQAHCLTDSRIIWGERIDR